VDWKHEYWALQLFVKTFANLRFYNSRGVAGNKLKMTLGLPWYVPTVTSPQNKRILRTRNLEHEHEPNLSVNISLPIA
jgi:hypothetical protein